MNDQAAPRRCIACDVVPRRHFRLSNGERLLRCPRCGLGWWAWPAFNPADFYDRDYFQSAVAARGYDDYASLETGLRRTARGRLRRIAQALATGGQLAGTGRRLLDIGCGPGIFLDEARRAGWDVSGIEVSAYAAEEARRRGLRVTCAAGEAVELEAGTFDCITLWDALEHLRDPAGLLNRAVQALRPGGVLALSTGDVTSLCARLSGLHWHLFSVPEHLFFFSPTGLQKLMHRAGCRTARLRREVNWVPLAYLAERVRKSLGGAAGSGPRRGGLVLPATLFDVLGLYAVRQR